jgi:hypothetical protein
MPYSILDPYQEETQKNFRFKLQSEYDFGTKIRALVQYLLKVVQTIQSAGGDKQAVPTLETAFK